VRLAEPPTNGGMAQTNTCLMGLPAVQNLQRAILGRSKFDSMKKLTNSKAISNLGTYHREFEVTIGPKPYSRLACSSAIFTLELVLATYRAT